MAPVEEAKPVKGRKRAKGEVGRIKTQLEALPKQVKQQAWQIRFLTEELRGATTEVERDVILDWLARAKERRVELETDLERFRSEYKAIRGKRSRKRATTVEGDRAS